MIIISMLVSFAIIFIAGMHWATYDQRGHRVSLWWAIGMSLLGLYNLINLVGMVKHGC